MSTDKEGTLSVKSFDGISRYFASPNNPPNKLFTIQNLYSPNRGELAYLPGTSQQDIAPFLGYTVNSGNGTNVTNGIVFGSYNLNGRALASYQINYNILWPKAIDEAHDPFVFAPSGTPGTSRHYKVTGTIVGIEIQLQTTTVAFGANGVTVTLPSTINSEDYKHIGCINFYQETTSGIDENIWVCSVVRDTSNVFPTSVDIKASVATVVATQPQDPISSVIFTPGTGGNLVPGKTYYFGFAPHIKKGGFAHSSQTIVNDFIAGTPQIQIAYVLPLGFNSITIQPTLTGMYDTTNTYTNTIVLMGTSPEDMLVANISGRGFSSNFVYQPIPVTAANLGVTIVQEPVETNLGTTSVGVVTAANVLNGRQQLFNLNDVDDGTTGPTPVSTYPILTGFIAYDPGTFSVGDATHRTARYVYPARGNQQLAGSGVDQAAENYDFRPLWVQHPNGSGSNTQYGTPYSRTVMGARLYLANNLQTPFYTDGRVMKPIQPDYQTALPPVVAYVTTFQNHLIFAGSPNIFGKSLNGATSQPATNFVYYTSLDSAGGPNPFSFTTTPSATPVRNFMSASTSNGGAVVGLGIFSYNQSTSGQQTQLMVGLDNAIFFTADVSAGLKEVEKNVGFLSPRCFVNTNAGPVFFGKEQVYTVGQGGNVSPFGHDVAKIIGAISKSVYPPLAFYHQGHVKLAYDSGAAIGYDRELWCDMQPGEDGQPRRVWTGPHTAELFTDVVSFPYGVYDSYANEDLYLTVYTTGVNPPYPPAGSTPNYAQVRGVKALSSAVECVVEFNQLYLQTEDFLKTLTRFYLRSVCSAPLTVTITFSLVDQDGQGLGTGDGTPTTYTETLSLSAGYKLNQKIFTNRYRGSVVKDLTLTWTPAANATINIYELALLFSTGRRRLV